MASFTVSYYFVDENFFAAINKKKKYKMSFKNNEIFFLFKQAVPVFKASKYSFVSVPATNNMLSLIF